MWDCELATLAKVSDRKISYPSESFSIRSLHEDSNPKYKDSYWRINFSQSEVSLYKFLSESQSEPIRNQPKNSDPNESQLIYISWVSLHNKLNKRNRKDL